MRKLTLQGGIHPPLCKKKSSDQPIEELPSPPLVVIPLRKNHQSRVTVLVKAGDTVCAGQILAQPDNALAVAAHATIAGKIISISNRIHPSGAQILSAEIENDGSGSVPAVNPPAEHWNNDTPEHLAQTLASAGMVEMGGSGLSLHVRLNTAREKQCSVLVINGIESEPYLCADFRLLSERCAEVIRGAQIMAKIAGAQRIILTITERKKHAINSEIEKAIEACCEPVKVELMKAHSGFPQDDPRLLVRSMTRKTLFARAIAADQHCHVEAASTAAAVCDAVEQNLPVLRRFITVAGPVVPNPLNLKVPIGTPVRTILEHCNTDFEHLVTAVAGGPLRGIALADLQAPLTDATTGIFATNRCAPGLTGTPCIHCGDCLRSCPVNLQPVMISRAVAAHDDHRTRSLGVEECLECGACAYVCPAHIRLVQAMQLGKRRLGLDPLIRNGFYGLTALDIVNGELS